MNDKPKRLWIVKDALKNPWGPFDDAESASKWAENKWKDAPVRMQAWDIVALREPD